MQVEQGLDGFKGWAEGKLAARGKEVCGLIPEATEAVGLSAECVPDWATVHMRMPGPLRVSRWELRTMHFVPLSRK